MRLKALTVVLAATAFLFLTAGDSLAGGPAGGGPAGGDFRAKFTKYYKGNNFYVLVTLVKKSKEIMPGEIEALLEEADDPGKSFNEKMELLDLASAMATMYKHWHGGGDDLIAKVEAMQRREKKKEDARLAKLNRWKKEESFLGNIVMQSSLAKMEAEGLTPALFPHWLHRIWYDCAACHDSVFPMKRETAVTHAAMDGGKLCGACHNGETAFNTTEECARCHVAGKPGAEALYRPTKKGVDHERIKAVAERVGAKWDYEKLPDGKLPTDKYKFIDWLKLKADGVIDPKPSLHGTESREVRDNVILFESNNSFLKNTLFNHRVHSQWIKCSSCHPSIFKDELGANVILMSEMSKGKNCGRCHGKVAFTFADCLRCHNQPKDKPVEGVLFRPKDAPPAEPIPGLPAETPAAPAPASPAR
ncbi:MAG TPA: hypothetical protein ENJ37_02720 [Deltaproteobacteria bacterium]|nr:hypothetical protein [Deltaproteobacteria bacterium]